MFRTICSLVLSLNLFASAALAGTAYDSLTADQKRIVQSGEQLTITRDVSGAPWPKVIVYQRVDATAEEGAAVLADYELQKSYMPNLTRSKIVRRIDRVTAEIDYTLDLPIAGEVAYGTRNRWSKLENGRAYRMDYKLTHAENMTEMTGMTRFEELGTGSLIICESFINPTSVFAPLLRGVAADTARESVQAIVDQIEKERIKKPELLQKQLTVLRAALP